MAAPDVDSIQVAVRVRPMNEREEAQGVLPIVNASEERKEVTIVRGCGSRQQRQTYSFDHVFTGYSTQSEVFEPLQPLIDSVMQGFEATVFAYGQTGTGKTHTMEGNLSVDAEKGVIPRAVEAIFERLSDKTKYSEFAVCASYLEIYNEELTDLLKELPPTPKGPGGFANKKASEKETKMDVVEDRGAPGKQGRGMIVNGLSEHTVTSSTDVLKLIRRAVERRQVQETNMNKTSSRSHCVFTLGVTSKSPTAEGDGMVESSGKLHLVDLAGSECAKAAGSGSASLERERKNINQSLLTLGRVISTLRSNSRERVPYRDSKLTRLLQESLGGRCKTLIIATLSPSVMAVEESFSTLKYAQDAQGIQNKPVATSYYHVLAPGEFGAAHGGAKTERAAGDGQTVEDWARMELKMAHLHSRMENAEAKLAKKNAEQAAILARAEKAEKERDDSREQLEAKERECEAVATQLAASQHELAKTNYVLAARRRTEGRLTGQVQSLMGKLGGAEEEADGLHAALLEAASQAADQLTRRGAFCSAANQGLEAARAKLESLSALLAAQRTAAAGAAAEAQAASREHAKALRAAAAQLAETGGAEVRRAADALDAAATEAGGKLSAGCEALQAQVAQMATAASAAHEEVVGSLEALEKAARSADANLNAWAAATGERQHEAGSALTAREGALAATLQEAAAAAAERLGAGEGRLHEHVGALQQLLDELTGAQAIEAQVTGALDLLGGSSLAAADAAVAELDGCRGAVQKAAEAQQRGQTDAALLAALDGAATSLDSTTEAASRSLRTQHATLSAALDEQAKGNASAAVLDGLRAARRAVDGATEARAAEFTAAREKLAVQQAALEQTEARQQALREQLSEAVLRSVQEALGSQLAQLASHLAGGVEAAVADSKAVCADADAARAAAAAAGAAHGAASEALQAQAGAWGASNEQVGAAVERGLKDGDHTLETVGAGAKVVGEAQQTAAQHARAWAKVDAKCRDSLAEAGAMHGAAVAAVRERQAAHEARVEALGGMVDGLRAAHSDCAARVAAGTEHTEESAAQLQAAREAGKAEAGAFGTALAATADARAAAFAAEADALGAMRAARPAALEAVVAQRAAAQSRAEQGVSALGDATNAQRAALGAMASEQAGLWAAECSKQREAADAAKTALQRGEDCAAAAAKAHTDAGDAATASRAERDAADAQAERDAAQAEAQEVGGVKTALSSFQQESDAVVPVDVPGRLPQSFDEPVAQTAPEEKLREHYEAHGDTPFEGSLEAALPPPPPVDVGEEASDASETDLSAKTVGELRTLLTSKGLSAAGQRPELMARLQSASSSDSKTPSKTPSGTPRRPRSDPEVLRQVAAAGAAPKAASATAQTKIPGALKSASRKHSGLALKDVRDGTLNSPQGRVKA